MTDCPNAEIRDLLPDWVNGSLSADAASEVGTHLATCAPCTAEAALLRALRDAVRAEPEIDLARITSAVTARTLGSPVRPAARRGWGPLVGALAVAASVVLGMLILRGEANTPAALSPMAAAAPDSPPAAGAAGSMPDDSAAPAGRVAAGAPALRLAEAGISVGGALSDLGSDELEALLRRLDAIEALPQTSPAPAIITDFEVRE